MAVQRCAPAERQRVPRKADACVNFELDHAGLYTGVACHDPLGLLRGPLHDSDSGQGVRSRAGTKNRYHAVGV